LTKLNQPTKEKQMKQTIYNKYKLQGKGNYDNYYIDTTDAATLIMKELKSVFPNVTFQKQTQKYSGGSSVNIYLADSFEFMKQKFGGNVNDEVYKVSCQGTAMSGGYVPKEKYDVSAMPNIQTAIPVSIYCYCFYSSKPKYGSKAYEVYKQTNQQQEAA